MEIDLDAVDPTGGAEVAILGPTLVGGAPATPRQRTLLAALALADRAGVDVERLADAVWSGAPPRSARSSLQNQITRLRRSHGDHLVVCVDGCYRLGVPTDAERFDRMVGLAEATDDPETRVRMLTTALHVWRGTPYADLTDHPDADIERTRLLRRRAVGVERLAEARLQLGQTDTCADELRLELERDVYQDRLWELLITALGQGGRHGDATASYHDYADRLRTDFGAEPPARLRALVFGDDTHAERHDGTPTLPLNRVGRFSCGHRTRTRCRQRDHRRTRRADG